MGYCSGHRGLLLAIAVTFAPAIGAAQSGLIDLTDPQWIDPGEVPREGPYITIESFPLPTTKGIDSELLSHLSEKVGVGGSSIAGIRLKVGLPAGYVLESVQIAAADAVFLVKDRPFLTRLGDFLARLARLLLLGRVVAASSGLEIPVEAWYVLFDATPLTDPSVTLHSAGEVRFEGNDSNLTNHGTFFVCRFLLAANPLSELVNVRIVGRNPRTRDEVRYHVPRLKLPSSPTPSSAAAATITASTLRFDLEPASAFSR